ncbi:metal ABC transporter permease [Streptomyces sp. CT34]|uniref:metal ABC transporter permease n=1 Tax=Streptomyces sp. CT34 TaxID=1553907 RepID=UPI000B192B27|nr:metal ABC transporter permease [Streptomyces sp. CT34]
MLSAISSAGAIVAASVAAGVVLLVVLIARPLLFATLDEAVAAARGVPVRLLGYGFLALAGISAAEATQAVGSLLLLGLLAAPAGAAIRLTDRPYRALALSAALAALEMWTGLFAAYTVPKIPPSFAVRLPHRGRPHDRQRLHCVAGTSQSRWLCDRAVSREHRSGCAPNGRLAGVWLSAAGVPRRVVSCPRRLCPARPRAAVVPGTGTASTSITAKCAAGSGC